MQESRRPTTRSASWSLVRGRGWSLTSPMLFISEHGPRKLGPHTVRHCKAPGMILIWSRLQHPGGSSIFPVAFEQHAQPSSPVQCPQQCPKNVGAFLWSSFQILRHPPDAVSFPEPLQVKLLGRSRRLNDALKLASDYQKERGGQSHGP